MNPIIKNIFAVFTGVIVGSLVNMSLIKLSEYIIPPPAGMIPGNMESIKASMHLLEPKHFIFPFLAHALGTFVGAFIAAKIAVTHKMKFALSIGFLFLIGGIAASLMIPAPTWFIALDLIAAYIPMAYLGGKLAIPQRVIS